MLNEAKIFREVAGLYRVTPLNLFRKTPGVVFDNVPMQAFPDAVISAIDRVVHETNGQSPGPVGDIPRPWYMHPHQDDNLIIPCGTRHVELYTKAHGRIERFTVTKDRILYGDEILFDGPAMLSWPRLVFHRVQSGTEGSVAINFAVHHEGIDIRTNFSIYELDLETGKFRVIREGYKDQP